MSGTELEDMAAAKGMNAARFAAQHLRQTQGRLEHKRTYTLISLEIIDFDMLSWKGISLMMDAAQQQATKHENLLASTHQKSYSWEPVKKAALGI